LANSAQALKRARQAEKHRVHNVDLRSAMRTKLKAVDVAIEAGDKKAATEALKAAVPHVDRLARKGILHMNNAARKKSRLNTAIRAL